MLNLMASFSLHLFTLAINFFIYSSLLSRICLVVTWELYYLVTIFVYACISSNYSFSLFDFILGKYFLGLCIDLVYNLKLCFWYDFVVS